MSKWIEVGKSVWDTAAFLTINKKISFFIGRSDSWGISAEINFYDQSVIFQILNLYIGFEIYHKALDNEDKS